MEFFKITLTDMQTFVETYQQNSISKAAEKLYISRQSVARSIDNLETALVHKLFLRTPSGITPTDFGTEFYAHCQKILKEMKDIMQFPAEYDRRKADRISFGIMGRYRTGYHVEQMIQTFTAENSDVRVDVVHHDAKDIIGAVESGEVDFAFTNINYAARNTSLEIMELEQEKFWLLVQKDHPFVKGKNISAEQLATQKILLVTRYNFPIYTLQDYMAEQGIKDFSFLTTSDLSLVPDCIRESNTTALLLKHSAKTILSGNPDIVAVQPDPPIFRRSGIVYRKNMVISASAVRLLDNLAQQFFDRIHMEVDET